MRRDLILSVIFHVFVVGALYASGEIIPGHKLDLGEVIKVSLVSLPDLPPSMQPPTDPLSVPKAVKSETPPEPVPDAKAKAITPAPKKETKVKKPYKSKAATGDKDQVGSESASADAAQGTGSPFGGMSADNASFDYPYWFTQAYTKIESNFSNPVDIDGVVVCQVYFQVLKSGRVAQVKVLKTSGIEAFDQACIAAIKAASPFPPFPKEFSEEILGITVPMRN